MQKKKKKKEFKPSLNCDCICVFVYPWGVWRGGCVLRHHKYGQENTLQSLKEILCCCYPDIFQKEAFFAYLLINFLISLCHSSYYLGFMLLFKNLQSYLVCIWLKHRESEWIELIRWSFFHAALPSYQLYFTVSIYIP